MAGAGVDWKTRPNKGCKFLQEERRFGEKASDIISDREQWETSHSHCHCHCHCVRTQVRWVHFAVCIKKKWEKIYIICTRPRGHMIHLLHQPNTTQHQTIYFIIGGWTFQHNSVLRRSLSPLSSLLADWIKPCIYTDHPPHLTHPFLYIAIRNQLSILGRYHSGFRQSEMHACIVWMVKKAQYA